MMAADRAEHVEKVIAPALAEGRWVVCDRYTGSTLAYQGFGRGLELEDLRRITGFASSGVEPDLQILLDLPVDSAQARTGRVADRIEKLGEEFFERVRTGYLSLARSEPERWVVIDAEPDPDTVGARVIEVVEERLGK